MKYDLKSDLKVERNVLLFFFFFLPQIFLLRLQVSFNKLLVI